MKYYLNTKTLEKFGFESDGSQDFLITEDMIEIKNLDSDGSPFYSYNADGSVNQETAPIPNTTNITKVQAMRQLKSMNLWTQFQTMLSSNQDANDEWTLALSLDINDTFVQSLAPALGITLDQLQELFNEASKP